MLYHKPDQLEEAVALLQSSQGVTRLLAGGTDLLVQLKSEMIEPDHIIDIKAIDGMKSIAAHGGGFRIGAAVSGAELEEHEALSSAWPGLVESVGLIGSTQVQGRASMVGNLCNASPAADSVPAMIAAGATINIAGPGGARQAEVTELLVSPGKTSLAQGELVTSVDMPPRPARSGDAYLRFIPRTEMDIAVASAGVSLTLDASGQVSAARVAIGAVAPTALLVEAAGKALLGSKLDEAALDAMGAACSAACNPIDDKRGTVEFRIQTVAVLARRAAKIAYARAGGQS